MAKPALGKGLAALIGNKGTDTEPDPQIDLLPGEAVQQVPIDRLFASPLQPRKHFAEATLTELKDSIRQLGIIQPLIVRRLGENFELVAGERRWRAAKLIGLDTVPIIQREATDQEVLEMALIENLQRHDLNPIEEAGGYTRLAREFGLKQEEIALRVGKGRASVANAIRLLDLHGTIQDYIASSQLSVGHGKAILAVKNPDEQIAAAEHVLRQKMTVRQAEKFVKELNAPPAETPAPKEKERPQDAHTVHLQNKLRNHFSTHVQIKGGEKKGKIELEYYGNDDLSRILSLLGLELD